jgi:hypothetical protein
MFNENWYSDDQIKILSNLTGNIKNIEGDIIEIGCWEGRSTYNIANFVYPEILICNDTWLGNTEESICTNKKHITEIILENRNVYNIFIDNMNNLTKKNYQVVKKDCLKWLKTYDKPIKFCHIDASHDYESVYKTIELLLPHIVNGGILCGDDFIYSDTPELHGGVKRAISELLPNFKHNGNIWFWINK